ncbi:MAG: hypothetical protein WAU17_06830, partial [Nitrospirales bacterium]
TLWGVEVLAYCLLPNHYHLCVRTPAGNLGRVMRHPKLQETATHFGVESYGVVGWACAQVRAKQLCDSRFKSWVEQVDSNESTKDLTPNPVQAKDLSLNEKKGFAIGCGQSGLGLAQWEKST